MIVHKPHPRIDLGKTIANAWRIFGRAFFKLTLLSVVQLVPIAILSILIYYPRHPVEFVAQLRFAPSIRLLYYLVAIFALPLVEAWLFTGKARIAFAAARGEKSEFLSSLRFFRQFLNLYLGTLVLNLIPYLSTLGYLEIVELGSKLTGNPLWFGIPAMILFSLIFCCIAVRLSVASFVIVMERKNIITAIKRSFKLTGYNFWRIVELWLATVFPINLTGLILRLILTTGANPSIVVGLTKSEGPGLTIIIISWVIKVLVAVASVSFRSALYHSLLNREDIRLKERGKQQGENPGNKRIMEKVKPDAK